MTKQKQVKQTKKKTDKTTTLKTVDNIVVYF